MQDTIKAIFENGVFKPLQEVNFSECEKVELSIVSSSVKAIADPVLAELWDNEKDTAYDKL